jgi:hypothetical protein
MSDLNKNNINLLIFITCIIFFLFRWFLSFNNFSEDISSRLIFESVSDGYYYFSEFKLLADFNLNNSFYPFIDNLKNITIPTGAFALHLIFYKIFGLSSFIFLEFLFIFLFIIIFYKISRILEFDRVKSLTIAVVLFNIPILLQLLNLNDIQYFQVIFSNFYSLRFPRPMISNMFFFFFILFLLKVNKNEILNKKNCLIFGSISGFTFTSFYHFFILEQLFIAYALLYTFRFDIFNQFKKNFNHILLYIVSFLIISSPTLINMFFSEIDFLERQGFTTLDLNQKTFLLKYLFFKLFKTQFLLIFFTTSSIFFFINFNKNFDKFKIINPFFILFYLSIISPFIFISISPTYFSMGHLFNNIILIITFLLYFFLFCTFLNSFSKKKLFHKFINCLFFLIFIFCLFANVYQSNINYKDNQLSKNNLIKRNEFNSIVNIIKKIDQTKKEDIGLLTFDNQFITWSILNNIKYLNIINGVLIPRKHEMIEDDLVNTFKFLKLSKNNFHEFIKNKKLSSWRYRNDNIKDLFWMRYQANSLITYNNSTNFDPEVLKFINKSSPLMSQQLAMPNDEIQRFLIKFDSKISTHFNNPNIIIINKNNPILIKSNINLNYYCKSFVGIFYDFYYSYDLNSKCNN